MATIKSRVQTFQSLSVSSLSTLTSGNYCLSNNIVHSDNNPLDVLLDVSVSTSNTPANNKQILVFCQASIDGTNFTSGPTTGSTATNEPDLFYVGSVPMNEGNSVAHRRIFSLAAAYGGTLPKITRLVFKNDMGVAVTAASVQYAEVVGEAI